MMVNWRTMLIVEELEVELPKLDKLAPMMEEIAAAIASKAWDEEYRRRDRFLPLNNANCVPLKSQTTKNASSRLKASSEAESGGCRQDSATQGA